MGRTEYTSEWIAIGLSAEEAGVLGVCPSWNDREPLGSSPLAWVALLLGAKETLETAVVDGVTASGLRHEIARRLADLPASDIRRRVVMEMMRVK